VEPKSPFHHEEEEEEEEEVDDDKPSGRYVFVVSISCPAPRTLALCVLFTLRSGVNVEICGEGRTAA
jgi:glutathionyl-hydroquinone reductase